jgi:hypothetical protein
MNAEISPSVAILHELEQLGQAPATNVMPAAYAGISCVLWRPA